MPTRPPVVPVRLSNADFDTPNNFQGWHTDFTVNWIQTNGNMSSNYGMYGPGSDFKSITSPTKNITNLLPTGFKCSIPFCENESLIPQFYCKKLTTKRDLVCLFSPCPETLRNDNFGKCDLGYYLIISNDKYETDLASFRSRLISPVFNLVSNVKDVCINFQFNIYQNSTDGLRFYIENYENGDENVKIFEQFGPLLFDKWYLANIQLKNLYYNQFRVTVFYFEKPTF